MYSDKDFQAFLFRYKTEREPYGISISKSPLARMAVPIQYITFASVIKTV